MYSFYHRYWYRNAVKWRQSWQNDQLVSELKKCQRIVLHLWSVTLKIPLSIILLLLQSLCFHCIETLLKYVTSIHAIKRRKIQNFLGSTSENNASCSADTVSHFIFTCVLFCDFVINLFAEIEIGDAFRFLM